MDDFERELKLGFIEEAEQSIAEIELAFLALETDPTNKEHINKIFRLAHNLKGSSKAVGFEQFGQFTHEFESFALRVKNNQLQATAKVINTMLKASDQIKVMTEGLKENLDKVFDLGTLIDELKNYKEEGSAGAAEAAKPVEAPIELSEEDIARVLEQERQNSIAAAATESVVKVPPKPETPKAPEPAAAEASQGAGGAGGGAQTKAAAITEESIRVSMSKIESLLNLVGEMVILQSVLSQNSDGGDAHNFKKTTDQLGKVTKEIQDISMSLRMVPVKATFQKMQRIVRDTAQLLNKEVTLHLVGEETELDKSILENINDPLVHLIRNSVDHGIEAAEKRKAAGKSPRGQVYLRAFHRSGKLVIEVADDGGGLNAEKLKSIAVSKGIIKDTDVLSEMECFKLVFAPGFSTKEEVTEVSGRGVGMDVVKTNIEKLGGEIEIESALNKGTTFRITLPLTMAIIDGLIATYNTEKYVIPLSHVHETLRPKEAQIYEEQNLGTVLLLRGENVPMYFLGDFFGEKRMRDETDMIAFVFRNNNKPFAVLVDDIVGLQQIVVKRLSAGIQNMKGVGGTTILGDGKPSLILEPNDLLLRKITKNLQSNKKVKKLNNKEDVA